MTISAKNFAVISGVCLLFFPACGKPADTAAPSLPLAADGWADARADFLAPDGSTVGAVQIKEARSGVFLRLRLNDLAPGWHGLHLHETGDCSDGAAGFQASGGHVNPDGHAHGLDNPEGPERADLPNIFAGANGTATAEIFAPGLSLTVGAEGPVQNGLYNLMDADGFAIVAHVNADDHLTQPIGGAGERVACAAFGASGGGAQ